MTCQRIEKMTKAKTESARYEAGDMLIDIVAIERQARAAQAKAIADAMRMLGAWIARKLQALRLAISGQTA